ncbi:hypothetical protein TNCV_4888591 [Trichonephila clavipes]|nr:hypothetical protein TNCV_4888591 [Trichonephila clavipes]
MHALVWRERGIRNNPILIQERLHYRRGGLMIWAGISICGHTGQHIIRKGTPITQRYADEILKPHVISYVAVIGSANLSSFRTLGAENLHALLTLAYQNL